MFFFKKNLNNEKVKLLKSVDIFSKTPDEVLNKIANVLIQLDVKSGQQIIEKGEMGDCMYIIYKGKMRVHDGPHTIAEIDAGKIFGELSLLDPEPRSASVSAAEDSRLYRLDQRDFYNIIAHRVEVTNALIRMLVNRLRIQNNTIIAGLKKREKELTLLVAERTKDLQLAFEEITRKNTEITDSIRYAKRIQMAMLPPRTIIKRVFPQCFILYKPKDIVSGDFYWFSQLENRSVLAVVDCTGHGVPGAFMSVMGNSLLNQIVNEKGFFYPDDVLNELHKRIVETLNQVDPYGEKDNLNDGMDVVMLSVDFNTNEFMYSGANRPLYFLRDGELSEIRGDKYPIGGSAQYGERPSYTRHTLLLQAGDMMYAFSDGYADQFGGPEERKFMTGRFKELLRNIYHLPVEEQPEKLDSTIEEWRGEHEQIDDILVIGLKF